MSKIGLSLSADELATLAACQTYEPVQPAPQAAVVVPQTVPAPVVVAPSTVPAPVVVAPSTTAGATTVVPVLRPGFGRVESVTKLQASNTAGGLPALNRYGLKMEDGTVQWVDTRAENLNVGDRVEVTRDSYIRYPA